METQFKVGLKARIAPTEKPVLCTYLIMNTYLLPVVDTVLTLLPLVLSVSGPEIHRPCHRMSLVVNHQYLKYRNITIVFMKYKLLKTY